MHLLGLTSAAGIVNESSGEAATLDSREDPFHETCQNSFCRSGVGNPWAHGVDDEMISGDASESHGVHDIDS